MVMNRTPIALALVVALLVPGMALQAAPRRTRMSEAAQRKTTSTATASPDGKKRASASKKRKPAVETAEPAVVPASAVEPAPAAAAEPTPAPAQESGTAENLSPPPSSGPAQERPWAKGVSPENQKAALELFRTGNTLLKDSVFVQAIEKYRQALALWDHPAIHYNLALALLNLDQPLEVHEHLVAAMRYGVAPLDVEKLEHARAYRNLIEKQLAQVEVTCDVAGASVVMDGRPLFTAPGRFEGLVRAGPHTIVASKEGYITNNQSRALPAGEATKIELKLFTNDDLTQYRRKWSAWKPWVVVGAGVALAAGGGFLHMQSRDNYNAFDLGINACGGCVPDSGLADKRVQGDTMQKLAFTGYAVGGAALVTGAVLLYMNRLQPYHVEKTDTAAQSLSVAPVLGGGGTKGVSATFRF